MGRDAQQGGGMSSPMSWGPLSRLGLAVALATAAVDQAVKLWLLFVFDLGSRGYVELMPFLALALTWNPGISYGLFQQEGPFGQWALLALKAIAVALLWIWLARASSRLTAVSLGLIIGGAVGNAIDRLAYGAVADFALFHITTATFSFKWYVFNLADAAIVAGVVGLLYESLVGDRAAKAPGSAP
jgi:signal peptidase II